MKKRTLAFLLVIISGCFLYAQKPVCKDWKNGKFYMIASDESRIEIVRKGNKQVEYDVKTGSISTLRIKWTSPCTYTLVDWKKDKTKGDLADLIITVTIIETHDTYCMIDIKANLFPLNMQEPFYRNPD